MFSNRNEVNLVRRKVCGKTIYYYVFYDDAGIRRYRSTGERTKAKAWDYVMRRRDQGLLRTVERGRTLFGVYARDFFIWGKCPIIRDRLARGRKAAQSTAHTRLLLFRKHVLPYFSDVPMSSMTASRIDTWLMSLPKRAKIEPSTANLCYDVLRMVLDQAVRDGVMSSNPCTGVEKLGGVSERCDAFTLEEVWKVIGEPEDWPNPMHRVMCMTAAMTGMRVAEVYALQPEDVLPDRINVSWSYNRHDGRKPTKSGDKRVVPITGELHDQILGFSNGPGRYIFSLDGGETPMTYTCIYNGLNVRLNKLGIKGKTFHSFRAFVDTQLSLENINESVIRQIVGHKDAKMTEHYLHMESGDLRLVRDIQERIQQGMA